MYENKNKEISETIKPSEILYHCQYSINLLSNHLQEFLADQLKLWATVEVSF